MTFDEWRIAHPDAAADLDGVLGGLVPLNDGRPADKSEAWAQQQTRFSVAQQGGWTSRNNVGATPAKCPDCGAPRRPIRYGLANDSAPMNKKVKSSDLIGIIPRLITPDMVGTTIGQFSAIESKRPGWQYKDTEHERAQAAFLALVQRLGGFATFSTGEVEL